MSIRQSLRVAEHAAAQFATMSNRQFAAMGHRKPAGEDDATVDPFSWQKAERDRMVSASNKLLSALWHRHQRVLMVAKALGRNVTIPA